MTDALVMLGILSTDEGFAGGSFRLSRGGVQEAFAALGASLLATFRGEVPDVGGSPGEVVARKQRPHGGADLLHVDAQIGPGIGIDHLYSTARNRPPDRSELVGLRHRVPREVVGIVGNQRFIERAPLLKHIEALLK